MFSLPPPPQVNDFSSSSWQDWFFKLRAAVTTLYSSISSGGVPAGGSVDQVLTKDSGTDFDVIWADPPAGTPFNPIQGANITLTGTYPNITFASPSGHVPVAGTTGQMLVKVNGTDYNTTWATPIAQFNPVAGTNVTLSGTYPNITINSTAGGGTVNGGSFLQYAVVVGHTPSNTIRTLSSTGLNYQTLHGNASGDPTWGVVDISAGPPLDVQTHSLLQRDPVVGLGHFGFGEARHQIPLSDEATVHWEALACGAIEILGSHTKPNGCFGTPLGPHHSGSPAAGPITERLRLEQHYSADTTLSKLNRSPSPDSSAADNDHIGVIGTGHSTRP